MKMRLYFLCLVWLTALGLTAQEPAGTNAVVKLESMDKVRFRVEEDPSVGSTVVAVNPLGQVVVPVSMGFEDPVVTIAARGMTVDELKEAIQKQMEGRYYKKATVKLTLVDKTQKMGQALFIGECRGVMPIPPNEEVLLSTALIKLGYSEFANLKKVELYREDKATGKKQDPIILDMEAVIKKGDRSKDKDIVLQDGDRINVREKRLVF